ncbi:uncharacterized protein BCR38DRAFT_420801 [Pseudomassariella vexata]|uniref:Uncharacterized protein n=1 Tax=Pseudomassariella vexata TaxID=1141098 RepID=A0A1Y2EFI4_9PEZI|nr:uncharacterized protein BCR38DRAFT_420801 [Pseudomassariella vexata]ORY70026.1 hypothetical protein BCR38DRAFT_420801 [Pseudomassariella vexata]
MPTTTRTILAICSSTTSTVSSARMCSSTRSICAGISSASVTLLLKMRPGSRASRCPRKSASRAKCDRVSRCASGSPRRRPITVIRRITLSGAALTGAEACYDRVPRASSLTSALTRTGANTTRSSTPDASILNAWRVNSTSLSCGTS